MDALGYQAANCVLAFFWLVWENACTSVKREVCIQAAHLPMRQKKNCEMLAAFFFSDHARYLKLCMMVTSIGIYTRVPAWWPWSNFKVRGSSKKLCFHIRFLCRFRLTPYMAITHIDQRCAKCFSLPFPVLKADHYYHVPGKFASLLSAVSEFQKGLRENSPPGIHYCGGL